MMETEAKTGSPEIYLKEVYCAENPIRGPGYPGGDRSPQGTEECAQRPRETTATFDKHAHMKCGMVYSGPQLSRQDTGATLR